MSETIATGQWRVAWGPAAEGDEWVVVFRLDDLPRDSEGPQIVVTGTPMSSRDEAEGEDDVDVVVCKSFGNRTDFEFQVRNSVGELIENLRMDDPDDYHAGWESESLSEASERAMIVVEEFAGNPGYWHWDGSAEALRR
jgi:hypothetical protein